MTRQILKYLLPLLCGTALISCYGIEEEHYRELAPVTVSGVDEVIYAKATETLRLDGIRIGAPTTARSPANGPTANPKAISRGWPIRSTFPTRPRSTTPSTARAATCCA